MRTKGNNKVNIVTLGCAKNTVDSEVMATQLKYGGIDVGHERQDDSDIIVINTCGFIGDAKQESIDTILGYAQARKDGDIKQLFVSGCLVERYKEDLKKEIHHVDAWFGTHELPAFLKKFNLDYRHELLGERILSTQNHFAYLKISEGCDRPCSFCAIPLMRGKHISRPIEELVTEATHLAAGGTKELLIIAQDSTYYGLDLYKDRKLAELLQKLSEIDGIEWIRLHYAYPAGFPEDVLDVMATNDKICKYLDIPLQHGSSSILQKMRRGITREKTEALLEKIRTKVPGIAIRTTLIAGHPGETEADFQEMMKFVEQQQFERLGVFPYSHEENTFSHTYEDDVPEQVKDERVEKLMELQAEISFEHNQQKIGKTYKVLIDRMEGNYFIGRTEYDSPEVDNEVLIDASSHYVRIGDFVNITIDDATEFDLIGSPAR